MSFLYLMFYINLRALEILVRLAVSSLYAKLSLSPGCSFIFGINQSSYKETFIFASAA